MMPALHFRPAAADDDDASEPSRLFMSSLPPDRREEGLMMLRSVRENDFSTSSPASWPKRSLIALK